MKKYEKEAKERWGDTEAYKQSAERTKNWSKEDFAKIKKENDELLKEIVKNMNKGIESSEIQKLIGKWREGINKFYDAKIEICRGLGAMYVEDERFAKFYRKYHENLPLFICNAIFYYCDKNK